MKKKTENPKDTHYHPAICVKCKTELRPKTIGVVVCDMRANPPEPYRLIEADLWACPGCGMEVIYKFADQATSHYESDFAEELESAKARGMYENHERPQGPELMAELSQMTERLHSLRDSLPGNASPDAFENIDGALAYLGCAIQNLRESHGNQSPD